MSRLFLRYIAASLVVVYSSGVVVVPKGKHSQRKASLSTVLMHVDAIFAFSGARQYAESESVFPVRIHFEFHFMPMTAIMWIILRRKKPYKCVCRVSLGTHFFVGRPEGSRKYQL